MKPRVSGRGKEILKTGQQVLEAEGQAILMLVPRLSESFVEAVDLILKCEGRVIVTGLGKSGHIGRKIAATMSSLGTSSIFVHAAEAYHGDLGVVRTEDLVIILSKSGETREILELVQMLRSRSVKVIAITGAVHSQTAKYSDVVLDSGVEREADHLNLAPTASTTAALALGDALAVAAAKERGFAEKDFALFHPGGTLGKRLLLKVENLMHTGDVNPIIGEDITLEHGLEIMTAKMLGAVSVVNTAGKLVGIHTDGDNRRMQLKSRDLTMHDVLEKKMKQIMTANPKHIHKDRLATEALKMMEDFQITVLPVVDDAMKLVGMVHIHDLVQAGIGESRRLKRRSLED
ncbi:MAG: KpsF/GutQ family sugar-phosphate isomerase [bacterium]